MKKKGKVVGNKYFESIRDLEKYRKLKKELRFLNNETARLKKKIRKIEKSKAFKKLEKERVALNRKRQRIEIEINAKKTESLKKFCVGEDPNPAFYNKEWDGIHTNIRDQVFQTMRKLKIAKSNLDSGEIVSFVRKLVRMDLHKSGYSLNKKEQEINALEKEVDKLWEKQEKLREKPEKELRNVRDRYWTVDDAIDDLWVTKESHYLLKNKATRSESIETRMEKASERLQDKKVLKEAYEALDLTYKLSNGYSEEE